MISISLSGRLSPLAREPNKATRLTPRARNAVSFSRRGSEILVHLTRDGPFAHLAVCDQGPGVPAGQLDRIFDRYYSERRAETTSESPSSYFGIGLWIARRNVEAMGGTIEAENRSPRGLEVHVRLPLAPSRG